MERRELTPEEVFAGLTEAPAGPQRPAGVSEDPTPEEVFAAASAKVKTKAIVESPAPVVEEVVEEPVAEEPVVEKAIVESPENKEVKSTTKKANAK